MFGINTRSSDQNTRNHNYVWHPNMSWAGHDYVGRGCKKTQKDVQGRRSTTWEMRNFVWYENLVGMGCTQWTYGVFSAIQTKLRVCSDCSSTKVSQTTQELKNMSEIVGSIHDVKISTLFGIQNLLSFAIDWCFASLKQEQRSPTRYAKSKRH